MINLSQYSQTILGLVMGIITLIISQLIFFPQFFKIFKTKNTSGISLYSYVVYCASYIFYCLWSYGMYFNKIQTSVDPSVPLILFQLSIMFIVVTNSANLVLMSIILSLKIRNVILAQRQKISEIELSEIFLNKHKYLNFFKKNKLLLIVIFVDVIILLIVFLCLLFLTHPTYDGSEKQWVWVGICNLIATSCSEVMAWIQFAKTLKTRDVSGISLSWTIFIPTSGIMFFAYTLYLGFANGGKFYWPIICSLILNGFIPTITLLVYKIVRIVKAKKMGLSEIEYTKKIITKNKSKKNKK